MFFLRKSLLAIGITTYSVIIRSVLMKKSAFVADFPHIINYLFSKLNYKLYHFYSPGLKSLYLHLHQFTKKVNKGCQIR